MRRNNLALFYIGFGSILSQILLVREFLVSFYGNELSIGIIFACWLVWIGIGSTFGNKVIKRIRNLPRLLLALLAITPLITFVQILGVKFVRAFLNTTTGEFLSFIELLWYSFIVLSIGCFVWGMLFTLGAKLLTVGEKDSWSGVNKAYIVESIGSVVGGLLFSFLFATLFSTLQIVFLVLLIAWSFVIWIISNKNKLVASLCLVCPIIIFVVLLQPIRSLEHQINSHQWSFINDKLTFINSIDTKYQNLSLLRLENQHTLYADGRPVYNIPNKYDSELFTHSIMVHRVDAKRVLVLGGGFNGIVGEVLKYPVQEVEYVETDPALLPFVKPFMNTQDLQALSDPRVHIVLGDCREYLHRKGRSYDVILLNIGEPSTASMNRFFTFEFYHQSASRLSSNGIIAFSFPSSAEYLADELKDLNASIYHTFKRVFKNILIVPGTHAILIGTKDTSPFISSPDSLTIRYRKAAISSEYFSEYMYEELLSPDRVSFVTNTLESAKNYRLNTDSNPVTYYFDLLLWNRFLHGDNKYFSHFTRPRIFIAAGIGIGFLLLLLLRYRQPEAHVRTKLAVIIAFGGMTGMALNLLFLLNFQETFGQIYEMVGAMVAANMLGLALGTLTISWLMRKYKLKTMLLAVLILLICVVLLLPVLLDFLLFVQIIPVTLFVTIFCGGLIGMLFGIVNRFYLQSSLNVGSVYALDVTGSSVGALTTCSMLLPVLGIQEMSIFLALVLVPAIIAATFTQRDF